MKIVHAHDVPSQRRSGDQFTGGAWGDVLHEPGEGESGARVNLVLFAPGGRTWWHRHDRGQSIYVTAGAGIIKTEGQVAAEIAPGDLVVVHPNEWHWHGGTPEHFVLHLTVNPGNEGSTEWRGVEVPDEEYEAEVRLARAARSGGADASPGEGAR
jgi:quercetin dioxygenase-like cupin family protein